MNNDLKQIIDNCVELDPIELETIVEAVEGYVVKARIEECRMAWIAADKGWVYNHLNERIESLKESPNS